MPSIGEMKTSFFHGWLWVAVFWTFLSPWGRGQERQSDEGAFNTLFNGENLSGWDGVSDFWRVEDGLIIGETTTEKKAPHNTFLIYRDAEFGDFELRFRYKVEGYNSGVQYRSTDEGDHVMKGLQADFEARWHGDEKEPDKPRTDKFSGMFFEEKGRMFMGQRGDVVIVRGNPEEPLKPKIEKIASVGDPAELETFIKRDDWNDYTVIANGNHFVHIINGRVMSIGIDEDPLNFRKAGLVGFQLHSGPPMKIEIKDIRIRELGQ